MKLFLCSILSAVLCALCVTSGTAQNLSHAEKLPAPCEPWLVPTSSGFAHLQALHSEPGFGKDKPLQGYSIGDPTPEETFVLECINRARANPGAEGHRLDTTRDPDVVAAYQYWQTPTPAQVDSDFQKYPVRPPFAFNAALIASGRGHDSVMLLVDSQYHIGPDGDPPSRATAAGYPGYAGESAFAYAHSPWHMHCELQIDFGNPQLGHRDGNMDFSGRFTYNEIGVAIVHGTSTGTPPPGWPDVGPVVCVQEFGIQTPIKTYICGVVYNDKNHNNFYDIGEGIGGVTISAPGTAYTAISSSSGAYSLPYTSLGSVTVTASGGTIGTVRKTVQFNGENVKVDFTPDATNRVVTNFPPNDTLLNVSATTFTWNAVTGATKYRIQIDSMSNFSSPKMFVNDSSLTTTTKTVAGLKENVYYWRVQAKVNNAWAPYSDVQTFSVALPPAAIVLISPADGAHVGDSAIAFLWHAPLQQVSYMFIVANDKALVNAVIKDSNLQVSDDTSYTVYGNQLSTNATYYWTVLAKNDNGWSTPETPRSFMTSSSAGIEENAYGFDVSVSPNPTTSIARLSFTLSHESSVVIHIFNSLGQDVTTENLGRRGIGPHEWRWNASQLPGGSYYYELRAGDRLEAGRIQVVR